MSKAIWNRPMLLMAAATLCCIGGCGGVEPGEEEGVESTTDHVYSFPNFVRRVHAPAKFRPATYSVQATRRKVSAVYPPARYEPKHYSPSCSKFYCKSGYSIANHFPGYPNLNCMGGIQQCIQDCKQGYFYAHLAYCVQQCKPGCTYAAGMAGNWRCRCCPKESFYAHGYCYSGCKKGYDYLWYQPKLEWRCVARCPKGYSYYHKEYCVADCPKGYRYIYDKALHKYDITARRQWICVRFVKR